MGDKVEVDVNKSSSESSQDNKKKKNRCALCRKNMRLTGIVCRCGNTYCEVHRYSDKHDCTVDYRKLGAEEIRKNNPVLKSKKIEKF